ncbi:MAG: hypothetical protein ACE5F1_22555, partial [Planctomycetota bacterium]
IPSAFMMTSTLIAMVIKLLGFAKAETPDPLLLTVGTILLLLALWLLVEAFLVLRRPLPPERAGTDASL